MSVPPEEPTRPMPPPVDPVEPAYRETVVAPDDSAFRAEVLDRLGALRIWVALATLLSIVAIGLAAYALLREDDRGERVRGDGVRAGDVQALDRRLDQLEARPEGVRPADLKALRDEQVALADQVADVAAQAEANAAPEPEPAVAEDIEARDAIEALDQAVQDLDARVTALESQPPE